MEKITLRASGFCMKNVTGTKSAGGDTIHIEATRGPFARSSRCSFQVFVEKPDGVKNPVASGSLDTVKDKMRERNLEGDDVLGLVASVVGNKEKPELAKWFAKREILVLNALADGPKSLDQIAEQTGLKKSVALRAVMELISGKLSEMQETAPKRYQYSITDYGSDMLLTMREENQPVS